MARLSCRRVDRRAAYKVRTHCALAAPCLESKASRSLSDRFVLIASPQGHSNWSWASSIPHASDFSSPSHSEGRHAPARWAVDLEISLGTYLLTTPSLPRQALYSSPLGFVTSESFRIFDDKCRKIKEKFPIKLCSYPCVVNYHTRGGIGGTQQTLLWARPASNAPACNYITNSGVVWVGC